MNIKETVLYLTKKYNTSSPFELANALKITVFYEELGTINGYYNNPFRMKQIHINSSLDMHKAEYTCAHELGHAIFHPEASTPFLRSQTFLSVDKMEIEANAFAINLLVSDEIIEENRDFTKSQLARFLGYSLDLIELRLKTFQPGYSKIP
ncbi:MAG: ImmA/IrrE family metallo-endopeptidase [Lachnospiraceae bacterium]|nr:ImmA/IrrE family metallo-endopeptidase [Lachnospiraceae bacterium]